VLLVADAVLYLLCHGYLRPEFHLGLPGQLLALTDLTFFGLKHHGGLLLFASDVFPNLLLLTLLLFDLFNEIIQLVLQICILAITLIHNLLLLCNLVLKQLIFLFVNQRSELFGLCDSLRRLLEPLGVGVHFLIHVVYSHFKPLSILQQALQLSFLFVLERDDFL